MTRRGGVSLGRGQYFPQNSTPQCGEVLHHQGGKVTKVFLSLYFVTTLAPNQYVIAGNAHTLSQEKMSSEKSVQTF